MWWLIPTGVVVCLKLIYDAVLGKEYKARQRWENKREKVESSIEKYQRNINARIKQAQSSYDFHFLVNLHFFSMNVANSAYQLLDDARNSFSGMSKMLKKSKEQRSILQTELAKAKRTKDHKAIHETIEQLKMVNDLRKSVFADRDKVKEQEKKFLTKVRRLNNQTKKLKEFIRNRCDDGGREWYEGLEARKQAKRLAEGKQ